MSLTINRVRIPKYLLKALTATVKRLGKAATRQLLEDGDLDLAEVYFGDATDYAKLAWYVGNATHEDGAMTPSDAHELFDRFNALDTAAREELSYTDLRAFRFVTEGN